MKTVKALVAVALIPLGFVLAGAADGSKWAFEWVDEFCRRNTP